MSMMNEISINITKALITKVHIELKDDGKEKKVVFDVFGVLLTKENKKISEFIFSNETFWSEDKKIEVPITVHMQVKKIFEELTPVIYRKLNDEYPKIDAIASRRAETHSDKINPDDIPF